MTAAASLTSLSQNERSTNVLGSQPHASTGLFSCNCRAGLAKTQSVTEPAQRKRLADRGDERVQRVHVNV